MRVVLVSRFPVDPDKPKGGVETATVGLARALVAEGISDLHVVTLEQGLQADVVQEVHEGIQVHRLPRSSVPMFIDVFIGPSQRRLKSYLQTLQPDVVHFQETWGFGAHRYPFPSVFTLHGFDSLNLPTEHARGAAIRSKIWQWAEKRGMSRQRYVVSIAPYVRAQMEPFTNAKIYDIWNSLDARYFELPRSPVPDRVLFLGWINARKNPLTLVKAVGLLGDKVPGLHVQLCGAESDPSYAQALKAEINRLQLQGKVALLGSLSQTQVKERLTEASVLVLPALQENAPMVIAEAMAAGVPVIASNLCGIPDMVTHEHSGYLLDDPMDPQELADALAHVLGDEAVRERMVEAAKREAFLMFHPSEVAKATIAVYADAVNNR